MKVFKKFLQIYCDALRLNYEVINEQNCKVGNYEVSDHNCSCGFYFKTGLLCEHTLRSIWVKAKGNNYLEFIAERWKKKSNIEGEKGRSQSSRKNRH